MENAQWWLVICTQSPTMGLAMAMAALRTLGLPTRFKYSLAASTMVS